MKKIDKDINCIPEGDYCYELIDVKEKHDGNFIIKTKPCPYYENTDNGYCHFLDLNGDDSILLWDQVKECGIKLGDDYE